MRKVCFVVDELGCSIALYPLRRIHPEVRFFSNHERCQPVAIEVYKFSVRIGEVCRDAFKALKGSPSAIDLVSVKAALLCIVHYEL